MIYTADSFQEDCKKLAKRIRSFQFSHIISVERGGKYVTNELKKYYPNASIVPIKVSFYNGNKKKDVPDVECCSKKFSKNDKILICDDLVDSGITIDYIKNLPFLNDVDDIKVAVLIHKPTSTITPDFCIHNNVTSWCQFHWEDENGNHLSSV
jgi:hypoxanthine phosphoribosyltransferase